MSDPVDRRRQQNQQGWCFLCKKPTSGEMIVCEQCHELEYGTQQSFTVDQETHTASIGAKTKKRRKKNKKRQGTDKISEQNSNGHEMLKGGHDGKELRDVPLAEQGVHEPLKLDAKVKSGETFGDGGWRLSSKKSEDTTSLQAENSQATVGQTKLRYKDFYSDSEDEAEDKEDKLKEVHKSDKSAAPVSTSSSAHGASLEEALSRLKLEKDDSKNSREEKKEIRSDQGSSKWSKCSYCKKEGFLLNCSRCQLSSYCNRQCQKSDYPRHKVICRRKEKFDLVQSKIPVALKLPFIKRLGSFKVSPFLCDLPSEWEYAIGIRSCVVAEIIGPYFHLFRYGISIRDLAGEETHILFYIQNDIYMHRTSDNAVKPCPLPLCILPGNFILLLDAHWHGFLDGTVGIRINGLDEVHFIFEN